MSTGNVRELGDAALVVAIGRYRQDALAEAYHRHSASVYALARRLLRNDAMAEEVTQEIFLRLWDRPDRFDAERGALRSFLLADTHGRAVDLIRAEGSRRTREERDAAMMPATGYDLEDEVMAGAASSLVRNALDALKDAERRAIELAYFGGLTYQEVAARLDQPEGTVKSRIRAGMQKLRVELTTAGLEL